MDKPQSEEEIQVPNGVTDSDPSEIKSELMSLENATANEIKMEPPMAEESMSKKSESQNDNISELVKKEAPALDTAPNDNVHVQTAISDPDFVITTKNLERVREDLRQEEILQGRKSPFKSETASPVKVESVRLFAFFLNFRYCSVGLQGILNKISGNTVV